MDIYGHLKDDHGKQRGLAAGLVETSGDTAERRRLFEQLTKEIEAHAAVEEQTLYAELIGLPAGQEKARHSISEHKDAADLLEHLSEMDMSSSGWLIKFKQLLEELDHHIDEEEKEVFELAQSLISEDRANELGKDFEQLKAKALSD